MPPIAPRIEIADDFTITDDDLLLRRVPPSWTVLDENAGGRRPSSAAFQDDADGDPMSIYIRSIILGAGGRPERVLAGHPNFGLAGITAGQARGEDQKVHRDPLPDEPAHGNVCGRKPQGVRRRLAKCAIWVVRPGE